jgi:hypothetical protein
MGQLLVMLIVPPIVGVVTYIVVRLIWERDENGGSEIVRRRDPSAAAPAEGTSTEALVFRYLRVYAARRGKGRRTVWPQQKTTTQVYRATVAPV